MTDATSPGEPRPRPQYGEYATPEEQRARIRRPQPLPPLPEPGAPPATPVSPVGAPVKAAGMTPGRLIDRAAAVALLVYGLVSMVNAISAMLDPAPLLDAMGLDAGELGVTSTGGWGIAAALLLAGGWLLTAWLTWRAHRRGWILFWIPLAGGFVFNALSGLVVAFGLLSDPVVLQAVLDQAAG
ncbi:hypothetical protein ASD19_03100 [Microbacterium sp. Root53]|uniref:DUF6264 family protein n=1 Tax=Microbacterium sp. Root53 TaxID=1736553 RepID=UPI0006F43C0C|nr:DUF6264 family protein [Microbacterium sp. Root53]KQZ05005.1 hypothetical protein ASD19_03100 [Microbacterium sp. Root53]